MDKMFHKTTTTHARRGRSQRAYQQVAANYTYLHSSSSPSLHKPQGRSWQAGWDVLVSSTYSMLIVWVVRHCRAGAALVYDSRVQHGAGANLKGGRAMLLLSAQHRGGPIEGPVYSLVEHLRRDGQEGSGRILIRDLPRIGNATQASASRPQDEEPRRARVLTATFDAAGPLGLKLENHIGEGLRISTTPSGYAARTTELRRGDVLVALNGAPIAREMRTTDFRDALQVMRAKGPVTLTFETVASGS